MTQNPTSDKWHIIIRTKQSDNNHPDVITKERELKEFYSQYINPILDNKTHRCLIQRDIGTKDGNIHWHIHYERKLQVTGNTLRTHIQRFFTGQKISRISVIKDIKKSEIYTLKGNIPIYIVGYTEVEIRQLILAWVEPTEYKKKSNKTIVETIYDAAMIDKIDLKDRYEVIRYVVSYYRQARKSFTDHMIEAVVNGILVQDKDNFEEICLRIDSRMHRNNNLR